MSARGRASAVAAALLVAASAARADPQVEAPSPAAPVVTPPPPSGPPPDALPFAIAAEKRLDDEELAGKKEGVFVTGVPDFSSDPLNGVGIGAEGYVTNDGTRKDPFFAYTPYRTRISAAVFVTTRDQQEVELGVDAPYVLDGPWRLRTVAGYAKDPNQLYFGTTDASLRHLRSLYPARSPFAGQQVGSFDAYEDDLATARPGGPGEASVVGDDLYDYFVLQQAILNTSVERSFFESRVRAVAGFEIGYIDVSTYDGRGVEAKDRATGESGAVRNGTTRLSEDAAAGRVLGMGHGFVDIAQLGLVYDTRDFEPDPTRGIFAEVTNELSIPAIGSRFTFDKVFAQIKAYRKILAYRDQRLVVAGRFGTGYTIGGAPFFEYQDEWSTEGSIEGLGGFRTLRGYKQARFVARLMSFASLELRHRFARFSVLDQDLALMVVPFVDTGGVWNRPDDLSFDHLRISEGAGLRVAWNQSTIVSFDYAVSEEDRQFFVQLGHAF